MDSNKTAGEEARRQLHKNAARNLEQYLYIRDQISVNTVYMYIYVYICIYFLFDKSNPLILK